MAEITVILPSYNVADYIGECLESVVTQTFQDMEILCIDAGLPTAHWKSSKTIWDRMRGSD